MICSKGVCGENKYPFLDMLDVNNMLDVIDMLYVIDMQDVMNRKVNE